MKIIDAQKNDNRWINRFQYILLAVAIVFSPDTLVYGTNIQFKNSQTALIIQIGILLLILLYGFFCYHGRICFEKKIVNTVVLMTVFMFLSCLVLHQNFGGYVGTIIVLLTCVLYISTVDLETFFRQFENISLFLIAGALLMYGKADCSR